MSRLWLVERLTEWGDREAIVWRERSCSYRQLQQAVDAWSRRLDEFGLASGSVVAMEGDYSPQTCALLLALFDRRHIVVPLSMGAAAHRDEFLAIAEVQAVVHIAPDETWRLERCATAVTHPLLQRVQAAGAPGLVLFSSGSTGTSKAILHRADRLLDKFTARRPSLRTITFLLLDHIGGINTLCHTLANGGAVIAADDRSPQAVCRMIARHRAELLPASPTFLNLLLLSEAYREHDLSSLKRMTYGTEPMPAATLQRLAALFPHVRLQQTYGLSEVGILQSKSKTSSSLWVKVGGDGFETKVVQHVLWIRSRSAMVGYLNAPSPFDEDGWFNTQDVVEVDGEYLRILGRESDIINVGGAKVYPAEVENVLLQMANVRDVTVRGERNPILGQIVVAGFELVEPETPEALKRRVWEHCRERLARFQIPVKVEIVGRMAVSARFKKTRGAQPPHHTAEAHV